MVNSKENLKKSGEHSANQQIVEVIGNSEIDQRNDITDDADEEEDFGRHSLEHDRGYDGTHCLAEVHNASQQTELPVINLHLLLHFNCTRWQNA